MKNKQLLLVYCLIALPIIFGACKKYEDGPTISLRAKKARLCKAWQIEKYFENDVDKTTDAKNILNGYTITIKKDDTYSVTYKYLGVFDYSEAGTWSFENNKEWIRFIKTTPTSGSSDWRILRLKNDELWGKFTNTTNNTITVVHLIPK